MLSDVLEEDVKTELNKKYEDALSNIAKNVIKIFFLESKFLIKKA
jgi:hypothetical protein